MKPLKTKKHRKNIDLSDACVKRLSKIAIDKETDFKNFAQAILENFCEVNEPLKDKNPTK